jgi:ABC-type amino acid transport substrate-binding protein
MKKMWFVVAMVLVLITGMIACDSKSNTLIVGLECEYPPFNWSESKKTESNVKVINGDYAEGYDVQIAKLIAKDLNKELRILSVSFDGLIPALKSGDIDLIIAGMSPKEDRKTQIDFSDSYYTSNHVMVVKETSKYANASSFADLTGAKGVGQIGTIFADLVVFTTSQCNGYTLPAMDTIPGITTNLIQGDSDYTIVEYPVALGMVASNPGLKIILNRPNENIFQVSDDDRLVSIGVKKNNGTLLADVNASLAKISEEKRVELMTNAISNSSNE